SHREAAAPDARPGQLAHAGRARAAAGGRARGHPPGERAERIVRRSFSGRGAAGRGAGAGDPGTRTAGRIAGARTDHGAGARGARAMSGKAERMRWILAGLLAACFFVGPAGADSLWKDADRSFFVDHRARDVGDLVTVLIVEQASGSNTASGQTSKENKFTTSGGPGAGLFKFLGAFSADAKSKNDFSGSGQASVA